MVSAAAQLTPNPITAASTGLDRGYFDMYDVNFAAAHTVFQQLLAQRSDDSLAAASDAAAYLFGEFDRLHVIDVEFFADQSNPCTRANSHASISYTVGYIVARNR
jgi:hypothetical protein